MDNIIKFPNKKTPYVGEPRTIQDVDNMVDELKMHHVYETLQVLLPMLFTRLDAAGFDFGVDEGEEDPFIKDGAFAVEAIRAMLCKYHGLYHPFSDIAEHIFVPDDEDEYGTLKIVEAITVKFKDTNAEEGNG
jgi:hypothetical protein